MANTTIKITQLQNIGNGLASNTLLPVVNTTGTAITQKVTVGNVANFIMGQAGNTLAPAFLANIAYSVVNAAQPNITSVGTLNVNTLKISGGTNGYVLQTNGSGNLSWVAQSGSGNGSPGGSNSQLQFNLGGSFAGDPELTWDAGNNQLNTVNFAASSATIYGNVNAINVNASGNLRPNAIYTDHYYYANGYVFGGGGGNGAPGGTDTQIQFNDNGVFGGNAGFTFDKVTGILSSPFLVGSGNGLSNIQGSNISGAVATATYATNVAGANVSGEVTFAATANSVAVANVVGIGNIATLSLDGSTSNVLYGNGVFAPVAGVSTTGNVTFDNVTVQGVNGLNLSAGADFTANLAYMQVRAGDFPSHIHFDTGNSEAYDLIVGNDDKFVQVSSTGNILMSSYDGVDSYQWNMDTTGNLNLPFNGNINANGGGITQAINQELNIVVQDEEDDGWSLYNTITDGIGNNLARTTLDSTSFTINLDMLDGDNQWQFDGNTLQVSTDSTIRGFDSNVVLQAMNSSSNPVASIQSVSSINDPNIFTTIDATTTGANISVYDGGSNSGVGYTWQFANDGRLTFPGTPRIDTADDNFEVQAAEAISLEANTVVNIYTDSGNTAYQWQFGDDGVLTVPGNLVYIGASPAPSINGFDSANFAGNVTGGNIIGNGNTLSNVATKTSGSWTLASGVNTVSISVPLNGTYAIWVNGNIPNGIITYTATAVVTNPNVPVLGSQYAWYYLAGNALVLTSIPNQFVGAVGLISTETPYGGTTANVFTFGITNNSGSSQVVNYGYTKL